MMDFKCRKGRDKKQKEVRSKKEEVREMYVPDIG